MVLRKRMGYLLVSITHLRKSSSHVKMPASETTNKYAFVSIITIKNTHIYIIIKNYLLERKKRKRTNHALSKIHVPTRWAYVRGKKSSELRYYILSRDGKWSYMAYSGRFSPRSHVQLAAKIASARKAQKSGNLKVPSVRSLGPSIFTRSEQGNIESLCNG